MGKIVRSARVAEAVDGGGDVWQVERRLRQRVRQHRPNQPDPGQRQVIEGDVEEPVHRSCPRQGRCCSPFDFSANRSAWPSWPGRLQHGRDARATEEGPPRGAFGGGQEPVAVAEASASSRAGRTVAAFPSASVRLRRRASRLRLAGRTGAGHQPPWCDCSFAERIAALVGVGDRLAGIGHGFRQPAQRHLQLAEVAGTDRRVLPVLPLNGASPGRLASVAAASVRRPRARRR